MSKHSLHNQYLKFGFRWKPSGGCSCNDLYQRVIGDSGSLVIVKTKCTGEGKKRHEKCPWVIVHRKNGGEKGRSLNVAISGIQEFMKAQGILVSPPGKIVSPSVLKKEVEDSYMKLRRSIQQEAHESKENEGNKTKS